MVVPYLELTDSEMIYIDHCCQNTCNYFQKGYFSLSVFLKGELYSLHREQRFERVAKNLKVASVFNTLVEEMKAMGIAVNDDSQCTEVMAPVAFSDRSPVLLLMGGGMGAGKSTVLKDILKE